MRAYHKIEDADVRKQVYELTKALSERRRMEKLNKDAAQKKRWEEAKKSRPPTYWEADVQEKLDQLKSEVGTLAERAGALVRPVAKPRQDGNVIDGPWPN